MEYMGNENYWDEKFLERGDQPLNPENALVENIEFLKTGSVLDVACGDGRNSLYLSKQGLKVTGVDFSQEALGRLDLFAKKFGFDIKSNQVDLSKLNALSSLGKFDNIVINHYRLQKVQMDDIHNNLTDEGILFVCGFGHRHKPNEKIRLEDLIQPEDFSGLEEHFEKIKYTENEDERGFFVTYIFRKK